MHQRKGSGYVHIQVKSKQASPQALPSAVPVPGQTKQEPPPERLPVVPEKKKVLFHANQGQLHYHALMEELQEKEQKEVAEKKRQDFLADFHHHFWEEKLDFNKHYLSLTTWTAEVRKRCKPEKGQTYRRQYFLEALSQMQEKVKAYLDQAGEKLLELLKTSTTAETKKQLVDLVYNLSMASDVKPLFQPLLEALTQSRVKYLTLSPFPRHKSLGAKKTSSLETEDKDLDLLTSYFKRQHQKSLSGERAETAWEKILNCIEFAANSIDDTEGMKEADCGIYPMVLASLSGLSKKVRLACWGQMAANMISQQKPKPWHQTFCCFHAQEPQALKLFKGIAKLKLEAPDTLREEDFEQLKTLLVTLNPNYLRINEQPPLHRAPSSTAGQHSKNNSK